MSLIVGFRYDINHDDAQWVTNEDDADGTTHYVFGRIEQTTVAFTLALQLHDDAEPVAADLRRAVRVGRRLHRTTRSWSTAAPPTTRIATSPTPTPADADFNVRSFRTTNVLRWEYKPGSALFVVWQQGRRRS